MFAGHEDSVLCGSFTLNNKAVLTGSADGSVRLWNPKTGTCTHTYNKFEQGVGPWHAGPVTCMKTHHVEPLLITGSLDNTARVINLQHKKVRT